MANEQIKTCSALFVTEELQIKMTVGGITTMYKVNKLQRYILQ